VLADVERLKIVNDSLGRQAGDELLRQLADRLKRATDPACIARIGGDQFAIVLPEIKGRSEVARTTERIWRESFAQPFQLGSGEVRDFRKGGNCALPNDGVDAEVLLANAEAALREAKETGGARTVPFARSDRRRFRTVRAREQASAGAREGRIRAALPAQAGP
jgi:diguanylate cyclase (GGDEF)-like protein